MARARLLLLVSLFAFSSGCILEKSGTRDDAGIVVPVDAGDRDAALGDAGGRDAGPTRVDAGGRDAGELAMVQVAAGGDATCALRSDGAVFCWGHDDLGQLGDGTPGESRFTPMQVSLPGAAVAVALGDSHSCAIVMGGDLYCWGDNGDGQVGAGSTDAVIASPTHVAGRTATVAVGGAHTCLLDFDGTLFCWGNNAQGQLGFAGSGRNAPERVTLSGVVAPIALGQDFTCARMSDATVSCWGLNTDKQLGDGTNGSRSTPATVHLIDDAVSIGLGWKHACAIRASGLACWGRGNDGRLGDGAAMTQSEPSPVMGLTEAVAVRGGEDFTCARQAAGAVYCWGRDDHDQIAHGGSSNVPVVMGFLPGPADDLALGRGHGCVIIAGAVWCWGDGNQGQLGSDSDGSAAPLRVDGLLSP